MQAYKAKLKVGFAGPRVFIDYCFANQGHESQILLDDDNFMSPMLSDRDFDVVWHFVNRLDVRGKLANINLKEGPFTI